MITDLVCLVSDKDIEAALEGLLRNRRRALGIADLTFEIYVHSGRDSGCYKDGPEFLRQLLSDPAQRGLLVFDHAWEGNPNETAIQTEEKVRKELTGLSADVVVLEPEIEAWVWSPSPHVDSVLGWAGTNPPLREWLGQEGLWAVGAPKPTDPKEAMESALFQKRIPRSSLLYRELANQVSLRRCEDESFNRLCAVLRRWFPG